MTRWRSWATRAGQRHSEDDPGRENEGELIFAASLATTEVVAFCVRL